MHSKSLIISKSVYFLCPLSDLSELIQNNRSDFQIAQRERERELLLQHLLQYEQEAWELQSEMSNAYNEKHKLLKKQQG